MTTGRDGERLTREGKENLRSKLQKVFQMSKDLGPISVRVNPRLGAGCFRHKETPGPHQETLGITGRLTCVTLLGSKSETK